MSILKQSYASPAQIRKTIAAIAGKMGVTPEVAAAEVSKLLPQLIDKLTPDGALCSNN